MEDGAALGGGQEIGCRDVCWKGWNAGLAEVLGSPTG